MRFIKSAIVLSALCSVALAWSSRAQAEWKPTESVEFVVPFVAGGGADLLARTIVQVITEEKLVPVPIQITNRGGGGTAVGLSYVLANRADNPNTLILVASTTSTNHIVVPSAPGLDDVLPIYDFMADDFVLVARADAPWKDAAELVKAAKDMPPKTLNAGSGGSASASDSMALEAFRRGSGVDFNVVHFNGGSEVVPALLGGHVDLSSSNPSEYTGQLEAKAVKILGVFRDERFAQLPDVRTMKEQGITVSPPQIWRGVALPKGVPDDAVAYWVGVMDKVAASPKLKSLLEDNLATPMSLKGQELKDYITGQEAIVRSFLGK